MFTITMRFAVAASTLILLITSLFVSNGPTPLKAETVPFSKVLDQLRGASTLELSLVKNGAVSHILVRAPGLLRKEFSDIRYEIAAGSRLWKIDESDNTVEEGDSPWFLNPSSQIDLLGLLDLGVTDSSALLRAKPVERAVHRGTKAGTTGNEGNSPKGQVEIATDHQTPCFVYRVELPTMSGGVEVEAFANRDDQRLMGIAAWPRGAKRNAGPPLAELRLIAMNNVVADEKFEVANSLTEDGRIGNVSHSQGIVVLRPILAKRWSPIGPQTLIKPGDWLRTELRGANAARVTLSSDVELTLGPGTLVECISPTKARLHQGVVQVSMDKPKAPTGTDAIQDNTGVTPGRPPAKKAEDFMLLAPREGSRALKWGEKRLVRVDRDEHLVDVPPTPVWLAGFEGTSNTESLGSLMVNLPDGRNEPLTVGYHKVSVEIRDQIARTTIEESFVNRTNVQLEGVFHFPLPQDASISGFGMWIGNNLVEADVVEKQRAREIYETTLRERRDPGLLEWTGGNLFKARVFPIEPHSEKRIKIVYTQVLPLRGNRYRYSYGLRSDMLRTNPLRELSLSVTVNSALGLKSVSCPTHAVRSQHTAHAGQVEFTAQEYTPTRDFEVVCEVDQDQSDVVIVPHRRGDDGYFLVQITPSFQKKVAGAARLNELISDESPLTVVLLCDTSASMDAEKRSRQSEFVAAILSSLGPDDRFQICACDVGTVWSSELPETATEENRSKALKFLSDRLSLGWTNLDRAFDEVLKKAAPGSQVVYIGDGIVTAGDTDPIAFVTRLGQRFVAGNGAGGTASGLQKPSQAPMTLHAVTVGNTFESTVQKGIATVGGGSVRAIGGEQTPQIVARELLNELAEPGLRDVSVEFRGLKVAAVYPKRLPNVAAGTQQILVGRYLPERGSGEQTGEVIVTGLRGSERVKFAARVSLKNAEEGNSFIPRLWGRAHLDHLLAQGHGTAIHDEIIRLSEEFHIITPLTSLLVLETDADRERFGVQRRYEMRDGERFFAAGRDNANYELLQQQMKRAGDWRIGLRKQILQSMHTAGRNLPKMVHDYERFRGNHRSDAFLSESSPLGSLLGNGVVFADRGQNSYFFDGSELESDMGREDFRVKSELSLGEDFGVENGRISMASEALDRDEPMSLGFQRGADAKDKDRLEADEGVFEGINLGKSLRSKSAIHAPEFDDAPTPDSTTPASLELIDSVSDTSFFDEKGEMSSRGLDLADHRFGRHYSSRNPDYTSWVNTLFPKVEPPSVARFPANDDPGLWSPEAISIANSLLRMESLQQIEGGIELHRQIDSWDPRWNRSNGRSVDLALYAPTGWLTRSLNADQQTLINYCHSEERGIYSLAFLLGRTRASVPSDLKSPPLGLTDFSLSPIAQVYSRFAGRIEVGGENRVTLVLTTKNAAAEIKLTIDTMRHVVLNLSTYRDGTLTGSTNYSDFVELAGSWWATKIVQTEEESRLITETRLEIKLLNKNQYAERMKAELIAKPSVELIRIPMAPLRISRQKVADGSAKFDDRLMMILYLAQRQQWDEMWKHVDAAEKLVADKPGVRWVRTILLATIRRNEEALQRLRDEAKRLLPAATQDEVYLADFMQAQARSLGSVSEVDQFHQLLKPIYERPFDLRPPQFRSLRGDQEVADLRATAEIQRQISQRWLDVEMSNLEGRHEEALELRRSTAESTVWDQSRQLTYSQRLAAAGRFGEAHAWLRKALARPELSPGEDDALRSEVANLFRQQAEWKSLLNWTTEWIARNPESTSYSSAYSQHLSAMIFNDQLDSAYLLADEWLKDARVAGKMTALQRARLEAALNFANGNLYQVNFQRMDNRWFEPLGETARFFIQHPHHVELARRCVSNYYFVQSDISDQLRGEWLSLLRTEIASLPPSQIDTLVGWTLSGRMELSDPINGRKQLDASEIPTGIWASIAKTLKERWLASQDTDEKWSLGETLRTIYANRFAGNELLPFLQERAANADRDHKQQSIVALFELLIATPWSDAIEREAFVTWRLLSNEAIPVRRLAAELPALMRLIDAMLANRISAAERILNDQGGQDKLTWKELAAKRAEIRKSARRELSRRLLAESSLEEVAPVDGQPPQVVSAVSRHEWLQIERFWLDLQDEQNFDQIAEECWRILGATPPRAALRSDEPSPDGVLDDVKDNTAMRAEQSYFEAQLRQRALAMVMFLTSRKQANSESIERVLKYIDAGIADEEAAKNDPAMTQPNQSYWRGLKFRFLIALDRADDLEKSLREWIRTDVSTGPWRQALARLVAERGKLDEAIQLCEACERDKLLSAADYKMLADWYLTVNRRDAYERSRVEAYLQLPERNLSQMVYRSRNRWQQTDVPLPGELDENTLFALQALFKKSAQPENDLWEVQNLYAASRDFRLLQILPDAVLGRSSQQGYSFIQSLQSRVLSEMRNEATADEILARIRQLRAADRTTTDLRALDLLEAAVERKSAEILNEPGPHIDACLAALQRAFVREWSEGEPKMMSQFLVNFEGFSNEKLQSEQLRELRALRSLVPETSRDHLAITSNLCQLLFWNYSRHHTALQEMEVEIQGYLHANEGIWPHADHEYLGRYIQMLQGANRHEAGESVLKKHLVHPENEEQKRWLHDQLMSLYNHALEHDGSVSLGTGRTNLFAALVKMTLKEIESAPDENVRYSLVARLNTTFDIGHRHQLPATVAAVRTFAFEAMPNIVRRQVSQYHNTVIAILPSVRTILEPRLRLQYVVERMEQWPQRLEVQYETSWTSLGSELAEFREAAGTTDLDSRVLKLAMTRLQRDLRNGDGGNWAIFHMSYQYCWREKVLDFAKAAEETLNERRASGRRAVVVSNYLRHGLQNNARAIEVLLIADQKGLLDESAQFQLATWLRQDNRFAEMIPILERLVSAHPYQINYRTELMVALANSQRPEQLRDLIDSTDQYFHQAGRWTEANIAQFGRGCQGAMQWEKMQACFTEAIALHQRFYPASGRNDNQLSDYYQQLARAESHLNHTEAAVTAASAAIVCWDARHTQRQNAINTLREVLNASQNLDAYLAHLNSEAAKSGQDSPILRKAIADTLRNRRDFANAITQYNLAVELQPNDKELHQALIGCYDATQNPVAATAQLRKLIDLQRHDLSLFQQLATRLKDNEFEAERAATSIIESAPNEAESHAAMAELRQNQNRWNEAIPHWEQVSHLRKLEPMGLLKLTAAQIHEKQWDAAKASLDKLNRTEWPSRFNRVNMEVMQLQMQLPK